MKVLHPLAGCLLVLLLLLTGCDSGTEGDSTRPTISFQFLSSGMIVDSLFTADMSVLDNQGVARVVFEVDGVLLDSLTQYNPPWSPLISFGPRRIGETMTLRAIAYDDAGNSRSTESLTLYNSWKEFSSKSAGQDEISLYRIFTRYDGYFLGFRIETYGTWDDPYGDERGVDCALFFDTDSDPTTGLNAESGYHYYPSDIGADFTAFLGVAGDSLAAWQAADTSWASPTSLEAVILPSNAQSLEFAIEPHELGDPSSLDLTVGFRSKINGEIIEDWLPGIGHLTMPITIDYFSGLIFISDKTTTSSTPHTGHTGTSYWR